MQFSKLFLAATAFAVAQAKISFTNTVFNNVTAGEPFTFTWADAAGPVSIILKNGDPAALQTVSTIASSLSGTSYTWDVPSTLTADTYAFEITDGETTNYSVETQLIGGVSSSASASASSTSGSSSTGSTSSASTTSTVSATTLTGSTTSTGSTSTGSSTTSTGSTSSGTHTTTATPSAATTTAPGAASGLESPLAFVFLALAAFFTLN